MYAVVDIAGSQYKVQEGDHIRVARIDAEEGASLTLPHVLLVGGSEEIKVGTPQVEGAEAPQDLPPKKWASAILYRTSD